MPTSEARTLANQANALKSTGPKTEEGKARSRANAYKHGLTGAGMVMPEDEVAEVERIARALRDDLKPPGEIGRLLVQQVATLHVRMQRSFEQETAAITERVRKVMDEFVAPEGVDAEAAETLRAEAGGIALFDPSREACLARKYEAAARRGFFRAISDLRQLSKPAKAAGPLADAKASRGEALGSFLQAEAAFATHEVRTPTPIPAARPRVTTPPLPAEFAAFPGGVDVPICIGRRR